jgi:protein ImuB
VVIVGVRLPCLRLAAALRHNLSPDAMAFLIECTGRRRVLEMTDAAARAGVRPGMALREATRLVPRAAIALDDPVRAERAWRRVLDVLAVLPGDVEDGGTGLAFLRVPPGDRPERWFARVRERLAPSGLAVRCGAASNRFVAFVATHRAADTVCRPGGEAAFVADAPLELLCLDDDILLRLRLLGVTTLGQLAALPAPYLRRFGSDALRWHELAHGQAEPAAVAGVW